MSATTYDQWATVLDDFFFDRAHAGEEILFAVDALSLAEASGLEEDEVSRSLADAVAGVIGSNWTVESLALRVAQWRREGASGPHPALPFLALTVLAASKMGENVGAHESIAAHNYYVPLRRLFNLHDAGRGAPGNFTVSITGLWCDLERWANEDRDGFRGRIVVRDPGHFSYIGLAIQHALIKSADLRQLDAFFRRIGLEPGEEVPPAELRRALAVWTDSRAEPWARRLQRISTDEALAAYCEAVLEREAMRWDGRPRDPRTGRPIGRIRLGISSIRRPIVGLFLQWDERIPKRVDLRLPSGNESSLTQRNGWYEPHPLPGADVALVMEQGLELRSNQIRFDFRPEVAYALAYQDALGAWTSVDAISFGDRYHVLARRSVIAEILSFGQQDSAAEVRIDDESTRFLPPGWALVTGLQLDSRPTTPPPASLASLVPSGGGPRIRLVGGLSVGPAPRCYLRGGEPTLALSSLVEDGHIFICREPTGSVERLRISYSESREVPLWPYRLEPGTYEVRHGDSAVRLQVVDGIAEASGPGAGQIRQRARGESDVVGTEVIPAQAIHALPFTVPAPLPKQVAYVVGARPNEVAPVELPRWISCQVGFDLSWSTIDAWPNFEAVWYLISNRTGCYEAYLLLEVEPETEVGSSSAWGKLIENATLADTQDESSELLWHRYCEAAGLAR